MTQQHPITPPPELVHQWRSEWIHNAPGDLDELGFLTQRGAQWGADQELEACLRLVEIDAGEDAYDFARYIRAARRSKSPSLKEQALSLVEQHEDGWRPSPKDWDTIRRALEALPDSIVVFPSQC